MGFTRTRNVRSDRIVISGFGCLTPLGNSRAELWDGFRHARSGVRRIAALDPSELPVQIAGEVRGIDPYEYLHSKERPHVSRAAALAIVATRQALQDANLNLETLSLDQRRAIGVVIGSGGGGLEFTERQYVHWLRGEVKKVSVYTVPTSTIGTLSSEISLAFGLHGQSHVISTGCTSSTDALFYAANSVMTRQADIVVSGGTDAPLAPGIITGFCLMRVLTQSWNHDPEKASRPFSADRDGFVLGEGAWIYVVETETSARSRGAPIYAEIAGYGATCDAHHRVRVDESGEDQTRAIVMALKDAGIHADEVDYVNLHGTATVLNDRNETRAVKAALGPPAYRIPMSSTKSMIGHPQGASGAAGISAVLFAMKEGLIPPTLNLEKPDPECDLDYVPFEPRRREVRVAVANCVGFGSKNSVLVLRKFSRE
ncbi:MAG: beta-ketoacyl-[acyl-carrier-protein] synthase family protein [Acidobacteria bacterium]|nr:beta-ketoacyl-[acyl-carrier-protein] synthase family protein [Acidobacteriota bacterium]